MESKSPVKKKRKISTLDKFITTCSVDSVVKTEEEAIDSDVKVENDVFISNLKVKKEAIDSNVIVENEAINSDVKDGSKATDARPAPSLKWKEIRADKLNVDYCSHFYSKTEADRIFMRLESDLEYFTGPLSKVFVYGKWHDVPRKQVTFGEPGLSYKFSGITVPSQPWPQVLLDVKEKVTKSTGHEFNFVLVNRYGNGNDYMGKHKDNEKELDPYTPIASVSFGQARDFIFTDGSPVKKDKSSHHSKQPSVKCTLEHGSLLSMNYPTNKYWYHMLPRRKSAPGVRINLTFRKIVKTS